MHPSASGPSPQQRAEIDSLAESFEQRLRSGDGMRIEDCLADRDTIRRPLLRKLLSVELKICGELKFSGPSEAAVDEYRGRFPEEQDIVDEVLRDSARIESPTLSVTTIHHDTDSPRVKDTTESPVPDRIGRYSIERRLGQGGFGVVYLAHDTKLDRPVALKMPRLKRFRSANQLANLVEEARKVAKLKHPLLVSVYDVQETATPPYIVQEFVDGQDLDAWARERQPTVEQLARIFEQIADAIGFAHADGLTHCDLKLGNVLMDQEGRPHVADFGLAVHETSQDLLRGQRFGTPHTMAPEQVRGEGHRLDGRTDVWAVGVMMYQLLTSRTPFSADSREELFEAIQNHDPKPPRQIDRSVPRELERICLKCLCKRRTERYNTADDLKEDLKAWLDRSDVPVSESTVITRPPSSPTIAVSSIKSEIPLTIVPKGLRSFDADDSEFFLDLLPGPKHRDGLPESIHFWKQRIEEFDADRTFSVALIYGPSGCGKSSLVKAGLLPNLSRSVTPIYVEATAGNTEVQIINQLRKHVHDLPPDVTLPQALEQIRLKPGRKKRLLVIDQFEQWLNAHSEIRNEELTLALRQCDGSGLQAVLMVRDDFYLAVNRMFQELEIGLQEGKNYRVVDLFDLKHARKLLIAMGRAYGKLDMELSEPQEQFLTNAVNELAVDGKVISVRLALFSDMMKSREYTPDALVEVGGVEGLGVSFLEESLSGRSASPPTRANAPMIRKVLASLLPDPGTDIKGAMRSKEELRAAAECEANDRRFDEVIRILDSELRLITPTDPESQSDPQVGECYYQLTHDFLVSSLRHWLMRRQKESRRGRMELRLSDLSAEWNRSPDNRRLPTTSEHLGIRLYTRKGQWTNQEKAFLRAARNFHLSRWGLVLLALLMVGFAFRTYASSKRAALAEQIVENERQQASLLLDALYGAPADAVPYAIGNLEPFRERAIPLLRDSLDDPDSDPDRKLRSTVALAAYGTVDHDRLIEAVRQSPSNACGNIVLALSHDPIISESALQDAARAADVEGDDRLKARYAICSLQLGNVALATEMCALQPDPTERSVFVKTLTSWHGDVAVLLDVADKSKSDALCACVCLGIGKTFPGKELNKATAASVQQQLVDWFQEAPDACLHGASGWALSRLETPLPKLDAGQEPDGLRRWRINTVGMTMVALGGHAADRLQVGGSNALWMADREISRRLFQRFMTDAEYPASGKPTAWEGAEVKRSASLEHPVQKVSWFDAVLFCNWLSVKDGLNPCYEVDGQNVTPDFSASGYRLPSEREWEYACRAGTTSTFSSGESEETLHDYAVYLANQTAPCATKMPNGWGLFDMHGNVYEWCQDWLTPEEKLRVLRGGAFDYASQKARSSFRQDARPTYRSYTIGFRVVKQAPL